MHKRFGDTTALAGLSLTLGAGEVLALLGPNGAGKTTALSILLGLRRPDRGQARLFGLDPRRPQARMHVGVTPQEVSFPGTLRVRELVALVQAHFERPVAPAELLEQFGLARLERRQAGGLSGGERRRLAVALAFAGRPQALFLDEPTTGLDVEARRRVWTAVRDYAQSGGTVLLTTHYLEEADALASRVVLVSRGREVAQGTPADVRRQAGLKRVRLRASTLPSLPGVVSVERDEGVFTLHVADADEVVAALVRSGVELRDLEVTGLSLEEAFLVLTRGTS